MLGLRAVTLRSRLHRARRRLRERLIRRGVAPGALAASWIATSPAPATELSEATITAAIGFAARPSAMGAVPARVAALTEGVLQAMFLTKLKLAAVATVALGVLAAGVVAQQPGAPNRTGSDEDRLRQVEQKLDRVLDALENRAGTPKYADPFTVNTGAATKKAEVPNPGMAPPGPDTAPPGAEPKGVAFDRGGTFGITSETPRTPGDRLARVERRLDDLERRIARLEQQHAASGGPGGGAGIGTISVDRVSGTAVETAPAVK